MAYNTWMIELSVLAKYRSDSWKALGSESSIRIFDGSSVRVLKVTIKREARMGQLVSFIAFSYDPERAANQHGETRVTDP